MSFEINLTSNNKSVSIQPNERISLTSEKQSVFLQSREVTAVISVCNRFFQSVHLQDNKFTNYLKEEDIEFVKDCIDQIENCWANLLDSLEQVVVKDKTIKVKHILDHYTSDYINISEVKNIENVFKVSIGLRNSFRLYLSVENKPNTETKYNIIFADVYHLAIPSKHRIDGELKSREEAEEITYDVNKENTICLSTFKN